MVARCRKSCPDSSGQRRPRSSRATLRNKLSPGDWLSRLRLCLSRFQTAPATAFALASALLARLHAQSRLAQKLTPFRPMVERSVEQSVPPAGSGPCDFTTARLSMAIMHASAAAGVVEGRQVRCRGSTAPHLPERPVRAPPSGNLRKFPRGLSQFPLSFSAESRRVLAPPVKSALSLGAALSAESKERTP